MASAPHNGSVMGYARLAHFRYWSLGTPLVRIRTSRAAPSLLMVGLATVPVAYALFLAGSLALWGAWLGFG